MSYWDHYYYERKPRIKPKAGIRAQSRGGAFGKSWWARRWIEVLESFNIGERLNRGRSYARHGQVVSIQIGQGVVKAKVQGTRPEPYKIQIGVKTLSPGQWKKLAKKLSSQAIFASKLLAGQMPENIEDAFKSAGLSLFPGKGKDLETDCSCPDWSNPCKHIAAVYYLLGEEFDRDPFLIFKLRGIEREKFIALLSEEPREKGQPSPKSKAPETMEPEPAPPEPEPISAEPSSFWGQRENQDCNLGEVIIPETRAALAKRLGSFPFWRGEENFMTALEKIYQRASDAGMEIFLGGSIFPGEDF